MKELIKARDVELSVIPRAQVMELAFGLTTEISLLFFTTFAQLSNHLLLHLVDVLLLFLQTLASLLYILLQELELVDI